MILTDSGRWHCTYGSWHDLDETCTCAPSLRVAPGSPDPATLPDPDRTHPAGLTWFSPLPARPITLGPSADHPELIPALDLAAGRFWTGAVHGARIARRRAVMDDAALDYALAPDPARSPHLALAMAEAADAWTQATHDYAKEIAA